MRQTRGVNKQQTAKLKGAEVLLKLAETAKKLGWEGPRDLSTNLDRYLYGDKSPKWGYLYKDSKKSKKPKTK